MNMQDRALVALAVLGALGASAAVPADSAGCESHSDSRARQKAEQKTVLLLRLLDDRFLVQRVSQSASQAASDAFEAAQSRATQAREALLAGCDLAAVRIVDEGIALATRASRLAKLSADGSTENYRSARLRALSYIDTLREQPETLRGIDPEDLAGIERQVQRAEELAIVGSFDEATRLLEPVVDRLERRLVAIYDRRTIVYEKSFAGPAEEYEYLLQQYRGYLLLFDRTEAARRPPFSASRRYAALLAEAEEQSGAAKQSARSGDWRAALKSMRAAVDRCESALRLLGIGF